MALPQTAIEQLSRRGHNSPGWSGKLLMFSGTIFFISIVVVLGLEYGYKPYVNSQVTKLDEQIKRFSQEIPAEDQQKITTFYSQLVNMSALLNAHVAASALFDWLERNTVTDVYYTKLSANVNNRQVSVSGVAKTLNDVAAQLKTFQEASSVEKVNFENVAVDAKGLWGFDAKIFLAAAFFKQNLSPTTQ